MKYTTLGTTGIRASLLGFGMWPIGGTQHAGDYGTVDDAAAVRAIRRALDLGVTLFDTAPAYGNGRAESILGEALAGRRDEAVIVTKCAVHWDYRDERWVTTSNREAILQSAEESLHRMGTDRIDVLLIHVPDPAGSPEGSMAAFKELVKSGKVRAVGVSNFTIEQLDEYRRHGSVQVQQSGYNLLDRRIEQKMVPYLGEANIGLMTYGSLCHGLFSGTWTSDTTFPSNDWRSKGDVFGLPLFAGDNFRKNVNVAQRLKEFAASSSHTLPQLAIAWVARHEYVATCLAGMITAAEVEDNVKGVEWALSASELQEIERILSDAAGTQGAEHYVVK
ncbi:MAG: aldo/keto reductase [Actinobacteria bacterium]|jgi:aryl-alcohol dehydrogenase-like predicted oxidoreductase|nr:aldo/keto reductase [Acidimicrobiia bacterium]NBX13088.1 aldo/keto reductase [Acidimicrobiia bacterium]NDE20096.1 aldo/keto reductase [Actinomycetota bacterium]NDG10240.1 aldo/keto reductase [Actinomycetota bacterium]